MPKTTPPWFDAGAPVPILEASPDAEFVLNPDEFDLEWRRCDVPASDFWLPPTFEAYCHSYCHYPHSPKALANVQSWIANVGDAQQALIHSPLLLSIDNDQITILDGHHRIAIAYYHHHLTFFPSCATLSLRKLVGASAP